MNLTTWCSSKRKWTKIVYGTLFHWKWLVTFHNHLTLDFWRLQGRAIWSIFTKSHNLKLLSAVQLSGKNPASNVEVLGSIPNICLSFFLFFFTTQLLHITSHHHTTSYAFPLPENVCTANLTQELHIYETGNLLLSYPSYWKIQTWVLLENTENNPNDIIFIWTLVMGEMG